MFLYSRWLGLSITTRIKIAEQFSIIKKGSTHVQDNKIQSDGYLVQDVENALSPKNIQMFVDTTETDPVILWNLLVQKIENPPPVFVQSLTSNETTMITPKKRGRPAKVK